MHCELRYYYFECYMFIVECVGTQHSEIVCYYSEKVCPRLGHSSPSTRRQLALDSEKVLYYCVLSYLLAVIYHF